MSTDLEKRLEEALNAFNDAEASGSSKADSYETKIKQLRKQIIIEKRNYKPPQHPALVFGPISMTVASMSIISLGLSILELPREMRPFFVLFSRMTIIAAICLVSYTAVIWYGYQEALSLLPIEKSEAELKLANLLKSKPERADKWAHTRSHPSAFLTTRMAAPRLFPFPMGKTRPEASVKDELWWEGGNAPHVGHFNKPKIAAPEGAPDEETLIARVKKGMEIDSQRALWSKRIREIQYLSCVVITYFVSNKVAILALCYLIYTTLARELENMLKPPLNMDEIYQVIDRMSVTGGRMQSAPKAALKGDGRKPTGGMTYIYDPSTTDRSGLEPSVKIPIVQVPSNVLMTTENPWYAGPGELIK